jgi:catechol 2,3-dioxygenase-like lactoylglutathione lyase family enzyme
MNELEPFRKRAKQLVRQHHDGVHVVADRLRRSLPRFEGLSDREVLDADFALHDAQQVIATELGFGSWGELKEAPPMSTTTTSTADERTDVRLTRALACVFVTDFDRSIAFYRDTLGFEVAYTYGEPPFWGEVRLDDIALNLRHVDTSPWVGDDREDGQLLSVSIETSDAKALFLRHQEAGVDFHQRLREQPWRRVEFVVRDPDGNLVLFGSEA